MNDKLCYSLLTYSDYQTNNLIVTVYIFITTPFKAV